jgi:uncharacterized protein (DUF1330 family)
MPEGPAFFQVSSHVTTVKWGGTQARAWYNDPEYAPLITLRQTGADLDFILVEGL